MKLILELDKKDYGTCQKRYTRNAVRAIIICEGKIALAKSSRVGFYKFPGGGIERNESHVDALIRETIEETGLHILPESVRDFGMVREVRASIFEQNEIFEQNSYYYLAAVDDSLSALRLDGYEAELGFCLEWANIRHAYNINLALSRKDGFDFLIRESEVLKMVMEYFDYK